MFASSDSREFTPNHFIGDAHGGLLDEVAMSNLGFSTYTNDTDWIDVDDLPADATQDWSDPIEVVPNDTDWFELVIDNEDEEAEIGMSDDTFENFAEPVSKRCTSRTTGNSRVRPPKLHGEKVVEVIDIVPVYRACWYDSEGDRLTTPRQQWIGEVWGKREVVANEGKQPRRTQHYQSWKNDRTRRHQYRAA